MPRPNQARDIYAEDHLAARIAMEREKRGWTYEGLAKRMSDVGCPLDQSAIYKIEKASPRRRITVDELVAFSRVFGVAIDDLLLPADLAADRRAIELFTQWREAMDATQQQRAKAVKAGERLEGHLREHPSAVDALLRAVSERQVLNAGDTLSVALPGGGYVSGTAHADGRLTIYRKPVDGGPDGEHREEV